MDSPSTSNVTADKPIETMSEQAKCTVQHQAVFTDGDAGHTFTVNSHADATYRQGASGEKTDISNFLSRPALIETITWNEGSTFGLQINPWSAYFNQSAVLRKIQNYARLRCKLKVKFVVNASPAYYGLAMASYMPLPQFQAGETKILLGQDQHIVSRSQRPHIYIKPSTSQGGCICLPFVLHKNWFDLPDLSDMDNMGILSVESITTLRNASGVAGGDINISVYAWAEEVELAHTTALIAQSGLVTQSGVQEEYGKGPISSVASAIGAVAGRLGDVPVIAPFARATQIGANAISGIASIFGYSRTPTIDDPKFVKNQPFTSFSSTGLGETVERLTMDPKQGLTVDSRTIGLDGTDEMTIASIVTRESYLTQVEWTEAANAGATLWKTQVHPMLGRRVNEDIWPTPMSYVGMPFGLWSGDIIFRFQIVCSNYHRGRMMVQWDPDGIPNSPLSNVNTRATQVVDISTTRDFEFRVPYASDKPFLYLDQFPGENFGASPPYDSATCNGGLLVSIANSLTSLSGSSDITIVISVRAADNMKYTRPRDLSNTVQLWAQSGLVAQSGVVSPDEHASVEGAPIGGQPLQLMDGHDEDSRLFSVFQGEQFLSIRDLMKRYTHSVTLVTEDTAVDYRSTRLEIMMPRYPPGRGVTTTGLGMFDSASGIATTNYVSVTPMNFFRNCYLAQRGGVRWRLNSFGSSFPEIQAARTVSIRSATGLTFTQSDPLASSAASIARSRSQEPAGFSGFHLTNGRTQMGLCIEAPNYSPYRFYSTTNRHSFIGLSVDESDLDSILWSITSDAKGTPTDSMTARFYCAAADDYALFFFLNCPVIHIDTMPNP